MFRRCNINRLGNCLSVAGFTPWRVIFILAMVMGNGLVEAANSVCYGTTKKGKLEGGVALPNQGKNFVSYSRLASVLGRNYVHSKTRDVLLSAYKQLETELPGKVYKYAETGFEEGGPFKPHKTHQNGLSVDFMVPVLDKQNNSVHLPTHAFNKFGYNIDFDNKGNYEQYRLDFEALGAHLVALHKAALKHNIEIWRVLFDPRLQPYLYNTRYGDYIKQHILIPKKRSWVRHDDHYHVDFKVKCRPMK